MFGFQRIGDFVWAGADMRTRGFMLGGTSGRTTLSGEGLQHQDGNSHILALPVPNLMAYDPAYAYEIAVILQDGIKRMYKDGENIFYYITVMNEPYVTQCIGDAPGVFVAATDYLKTLPNMISKWVPRRMATLGTDGFGRSEGRASLRDFFEVDAKFIALAALHELALDGKIEASAVEKAITELGINPEKWNPVVS